MDPSTSDITVTPTETSTMTPAITTTKKAAQKKKRSNKPKAARKLEPYRPNQPPVTLKSPPSQNKPMQSFNLSEIVTPSDHISGEPSFLNDLEMPNITTINEEDPWDIDFSGTERTANMTVKDVKEPLNDQKSNFIEDYMPTDDDIDSLADIDGYHPSILPYPGPCDFGTWLESQFSTIIPIGTAAFLEQLQMKSEKEIEYWTNLSAKDYLEMLGKEQYDQVRKTLAEIKTIRRYILEQQDKGISTKEKWSYLDFLSFRAMHLTLDMCYFPKSFDILDSRPGSIRNIRIITPPTLNRTSVPECPPPYQVNSPAIAKGNDPPSLIDSSHSKSTYHSSKPQMYLGGQYYNMNSPPQFWGASNSNWQRTQRLEPSQGSHKSKCSSHESQRSTSRRTGGPPDMSPPNSGHSVRTIDKKPSSRRTGGPPDDSPSNSGHSLRSLVPRTRQVAKVRNALSEKVQWDGQCSSFRQYKLAITGHLLQVGAAYMVDSSFHMSYSKYAKLGSDYLESEDFRLTYPDITLKQARLDRTYLYGMLISSNRKDGERKFILKYEASQDGIAAWIEFLRDYDNNGSEEVRATKLENMISTTYNYKYPGGFLKYIDTLQANLNELDILLPGQYLESHKKRILFRNLKNVKSLRHLIQACKDRDMTYQEAATYLRVHGAELDEEEQDPRKTNKSEKEEENSLSYEEAKEVYNTMAEEQGARRAYKVLRDYPKLRESLHINPKIWKRLSEEIQNKIRTIKDQLKAEENVQQPKHQGTKAIPPQYGLNRNTKNTVKESDEVDRLAAAIQSFDLDNVTMSDDDSSSDDDTRMGAMVKRVEGELEVQANVEYEKRFIHLIHSPRLSYALCDSGADSCVVGKLAKIESITMRTANLVGYDPQTTRSSSLPIVTALLKTISAENVPLLLRVHEAVYNQNSTITLLSEYQVREYGIVVDSVATKHLTTDGKRGTQTLYASDVVKCPLIDRGGLMGLRLYPFEEGDEDKYEIFTITSDEPWVPRTFQDGNKAYVTKNLTKNNSLKIVQNVQLKGIDPYYYDPTDDSEPIYGSEVELSLDENVLTTMTEAESEAQIYALKAWHRVIHKELEPSYLQPFLGYRPINIIQETLKRTTQLAKMVIRYPMRRHIKSRAPHLNVFRIEETISTDPLFANVKSIYHGYTCAQVFFGLKSHMINVYGMRSKGNFPEVYRDFIREQGCPSALRRDNAKEEQSEEVLKIHRDLFIKDQFTEPYHPQQNPVELRAVKYLKEHSHILLDQNRST